MGNDKNNKAAATEKNKAKKPKVEIAVADMITNEEQFRDQDDNIRKLSKAHFGRSLAGKKLYVQYMRAKATERKDAIVGKVELKFKKAMEKLDKRLESLNAQEDPKAKIALQIAKLQAKLAEAK